MSAARSEWILEYEGINRDRFIALAYIFETVQRQQMELAPDANIREGGECREQEELWLNHFLDRLALCFARFKRDKHMPANVTATGIVRESTEWTIYIAKNGGPHDDLDIRFSSELEAWLNKPEECKEWPDEREEMWSLIQEMWSRRVHIYASDVRKNSETLRYSEALDLYLFVYDGLGVSSSALNSDFEQVLKITKALDPDKELKDTTKKGKGGKPPSRTNLNLEDYHRCV